MSPRTLGTAFAVVLLVCVTSCGGPDLARDLGTQAVVIGIDGADWKIIDRLIEEGSMPHMKRLKGRSAWGKIETLADIPLSPVIWTSVATGKTAAKHGILELPRLCGALRRPQQQVVDDRAFASANLSALRIVSMTCSASLAR